MRGYAYDRRDVTGRGLANAYAQTLGTIFSSGGEKPYEVEIFVAEVGDRAEDDQIYRLTYDGQVADEHGFAVMGGSAEPVTTYLKEHYRDRRRSTTPAARRAGASARASSRRPAADPVERPRGRGARPHPHPAAQVQAADRRAAGRDPRQRRAPGRRAGDDRRRRHTPCRGASTEPGGPDDPTDPTDTPAPSPRWRTRSPASPTPPTPTPRSHPRADPGPPTRADPRRSVPERPASARIRAVPTS